MSQRGPEHGVRRRAEQEPSPQPANGAVLPDARLYVDHIGAGDVAVFLDVDCCPTGDVDEHGVLMQRRLRPVLERLCRLCVVGVMGSADVAELRGAVDLDGLVYIGNDGFEIVASSGERLDPRPADDYLADLARAADALGPRLAGIPGAELRRRRFLLEVDLRALDPPTRRHLEAVVREVCPDLKLTRRNGELALVPPVDWDRGQAVEWTLQRLGVNKPGATPVYLGRVGTAPPLFYSLEARGISVEVGPHRRGSRANFKLDNVDAVVEFLDDLTLRMERMRRRAQWLLRFEGYEPDKEGMREALCTLGNGYFATRGAASEADADGVHYPGTYVAGGYNRLESVRAGRRVELESLVNVPNWLCLKLRFDEEEWFALDEVDIIDFTQTLDLERGVLERGVRFCDKRGLTTSVHETRFVHMDDPHLAGLHLRVVAEDWSGTVELRSVVDARVVNANVPQHTALRTRHLEVLDLVELGPNSSLVRTRTTQSRLEVAQATRTRIYRGDEPIGDGRYVADADGVVGHHYTVDLCAGESVEVEKIVTLYTSRDVGISECGYNAAKRLRRAGRFGELLHSHVRAWSQIWRRFDIGLSLRDEPADAAHPALVLRLHIFHLVQTASPNTRDLDVGIPARGWHGEAYWGHIFWDELYVFPLLNFRVPEVTRALLLYRYRRLDEARARACEVGCRGALYPWQSGSDGEEETPPAHYIAAEGAWKPEHTWLQRHISAAVAYNVWQYFQVTNDLEFLDLYGGEIILEVARYYASLARYNDKSQRYEILNVVGPDEYHNRYLGADTLGIDNNAYTNVMAVWVLCRALEILELLPRYRANELCERLQLQHSEIEHWKAVSQRMRLFFFDGDIISQFEGYETLDELDRDAYRARLGDLQHVAQALEADGEDINRYKISKQADVLMLFYLFSNDELTQLFARLGYQLDEQMIRRNVDYYVERTSHASSLSRIVHSWVEADRNPSRAWALFEDALSSDIGDIQGGTTAQGIHLGAMAGTVDIVERSFIGLQVRHDVLHFQPNRPDEIDWLHVRLRYRGHSLAITLEGNELRISTDESPAPPIQIGFGGEVYEMGALELRCFALG